MKIIIKHSYLEIKNVKKKILWTLQELNFVFPEKCQNKSNKILDLIRYTIKITN